MIAAVPKSYLDSSHHAQNPRTRFNTKGHALFPWCDRTQAAFAPVVFIVLSSLNGGSLHAARATLDYKR